MKLKEVFATAAAASLILLTGCQSATDYTLEHIDSNAQCTQELNDGSVAAYKANEIKDVLFNTSLADKFEATLDSGKMTVCSADLDGKSFIYEGSKKLLVIDHDTDAHVPAFHLMHSSMLHKAELNKHWSAKLNPQDALIWANSLEAHRDASYISHVYDVFGTNSQAWSELKTTPGFEQATAVFEDSLKINSYDGQEATKQAFSESLLSKMDEQNSTFEFTKWYSSRLEPYEVPTMSLCLSFDGSLDPCLSSETVYPSADTGKSSLSADTIIDMISADGKSSYLTHADASEILDKAQNFEYSLKVHDTFAKIDTKLENCCDGSSHGGGFGIGGRGLGISLF
jgi:hypothetical protein